MIKGTKEGTIQEIDFTKILNKKKIISYWNILNINLKEHYAIRVIRKQYGKLNEGKVLAKSDLFIAKGIVPIEYLESNDYYLDEDDFTKYKLEIVEGSGISIKEINSKKYTIMKMSPPTFKKLFGSNILASGSSIYCNKEIEFSKNIDLLDGWGITEKEFINYYNNNLDIHIGSVTDSLSKKNLKKIKTFANNKISQIINENKDISDFIFFGIGNFEEPYIAKWLFECNEFKKNYIIPFNITTGSGRTKGIYTIVVKPKG